MCDIMLTQKMKEAVPSYRMDTNELQRTAKSLGSAINMRRWVSIKLNSNANTNSGAYSKENYD